METAYGIGVSNRFDLCCDDDVEDPLDIIRQKEAELQKLKNEKLLKDKSKRPSGKKPKDPPISKAISGNEQKTEERPFKSGKAGRPSSNRPIIVQNKSNEAANNTEGNLVISKWKEEPWSKGRGGFAGTRGPARGGGRGYNIGYDQRGKREFDRQSGSFKSGVKPIEKREGGGARNWGSMKDDVQFEDASEMEEQSTGMPHSVEGISSESVSQSKVKAEESCLTLNEWKEKEQSVRFFPTYNLRKSGEGEFDCKNWGKYMLKKKEMEDEEEEEYDEEETTKRGRQKHHLDIEIRFGDQQSHGRGRGRGFGRGGRGRGAANNETVSCEKKPAPKVDDLNDFPSL